MHWFSFIAALIMLFPASVLLYSRLSQPSAAGDGRILWVHLLMQGWCGIELAIALVALVIGAVLVGFSSLCCRQRKRGSGDIVSWTGSSLVFVFACIFSRMALAEALVWHARG